MSHEPYVAIVIDVLKRARKAKKLSQEDVAKKIGVSRFSIARIENATQNISVHMMMSYIAAVSDNALRLLDDINRRYFLQSEGLSRHEAASNVVYNSDLDMSVSDWMMPVGFDVSPYYESVDYHRPAVESYGNQMRTFIIDHHLFWHWVPEDKLSGLSLSSVVAATLIQGSATDVKQLIEILGVQTAAEVFRYTVNKERHDYPGNIKTYFMHYFDRHAPQYS